MHSETYQEHGLLTQKEAGRLLAVCGRTVRRLIQRGDLPPAIKVGHSPRLRVKDVLSFIQRGQSKACGETAAVENQKGGTKA